MLAVQAQPQATAARRLAPAQALVHAPSSPGLGADALSLQRKAPNPQAQGPQRSWVKAALVVGAVGVAAVLAGAWALRSGALFRAMAYGIPS